MKLKKLANSFYTDNPIVRQALDFNEVTQSWISGDKVRGHGVVQIQINALVFAIPVRSTIKHNASYILEVNRGPDRTIKGMGLDYQKAMLIRDAAHVSDKVFVLKSKDAGKKLQGKEEHVTKQFGRYVERYIVAVRNGDSRLLTYNEYRFTTLINYHEELGLT